MCRTVPIPASDVDSLFLLQQHILSPRDPPVTGPQISTIPSAATTSAGREYTCSLQGAQIRGFPNFI
jgi:hypothetical protein